MRPSSPWTHRQASQIRANLKPRPPSSVLITPFLFLFSSPHLFKHLCPLISLTLSSLLFSLLSSLLPSPQHPHIFPPSPAESQFVFLCVLGSSPKPIQPIFKPLVLNFANDYIKYQFVLYMNSIIRNLTHQIQTAF